MSRSSRQQLLTYEEFVEALEARPNKGVSPMRWAAENRERIPPGVVGEWLLRWARSTHPIDSYE